MGMGSCSRCCCRPSSALASGFGSLWLWLGLSLWFWPGLWLWLGLWLVGSALTLRSMAGWAELAPSAGPAGPGRAEAGRATAGTGRSLGCGCWGMVPGVLSLGYGPWVWFLGYGPLRTVPGYGT